MNASNGKLIGKFRGLLMRLHSPLARRQLGYILLFSSLTTLIGTSIQLYVEYHNDLSSIEVRIAEIEKTQLQSLTNSLWRLDDRQIQIQLNNILEMRDIVYLDVREAGAVLYTAERSHGGGRLIERQFPMRYPQGDGFQRIGTLTVTASAAGAMIRLWDRVLIVLATQGIKTFLVSFFILLIIHRLVTRHLMVLADHVRAIHPRHKPEPLALARSGHSEDEIGQVVAAINTMEETLHADFRTLHQTMAELEQSQQSLKQSRTLLKTVLSSLDEAVLLIAPEGWLIMDCNDTTERIFQTGPRDLVGGSSESLHISPDACREFEIRVKNAFASRGWYSGETTMRRTNGDHFPAEHYVTRIPDSEAAGSLMVHIIRDITERKQRELAFQESQKMVAIGTLSAGIAHDFNNMLGIVLGNAELISDEVPEVGEDNPRVLEIVQTCIRAKEVIQQLLNVGSQQERSLQPVAPGAVVKEAVTLLRFSMSRDVTVVTESPAGLHNVLAEPAQLHQVILNLGTNALHAMETRGGTLTFRLKNVDVDVDPALPAGSYVQLDVQDTGDGIAPEVLDKVFNPYFTTKPPGKGTGMGMAVVHGIVTGYSGSIAVTSSRGSGTTIRIRLPATQEPISIISVVDKAPVGGQGHVLLVDDESMMVEMGRQMLEALGYSVTSAQSGAEALAYLGETTNSVDVMITDLSMPEMDGIQLGEAVRTLYPDLAMVLCTGLNTDVNREASRKAGFRGYLGKPYTKSDLAAAVAEAMSVGLPR